MPTTLTPITDTFDGPDPFAGYERRFTGSDTTVTSTVLNGVWQIRSGTNPDGPNRWIRPITGAVDDGVMQ